MIQLRDILFELPVVFHMCDLENLYLKPRVYIRSCTVYIWTIYVSYTNLWLMSFGVHTSLNKFDRIFVLNKVFVESHTSQTVQ